MTIGTGFSEFHKMAASKNESLIQCHTDIVRASIMKNLGKASQNNKMRQELNFMMHLKTDF